MDPHLLWIINVSKIYLLIHICTKHIHQKIILIQTKLKTMTREQVRLCPVRLSHKICITNISNITLHCHLVTYISK